MNELILFSSTFAIVFFLVLQSQLVNNNMPTAAFFNSVAISASQLLLFKLAPNAAGAEIVAYIMGGPFGVLASMAAFKIYRNKKIKRTIQ